MPRPPPGSTGGAPQSRPARVVVLIFMVELLGSENHGIWMMGPPGRVGGGSTGGVPQSRPARVLVLIFMVELLGVLVNLGESGDLNVRATRTGRWHHRRRAAVAASAKLGLDDHESAPVFVVIQTARIAAWYSRLKTKRPSSRTREPSYVSDVERDRLLRRTAAVASRANLGLNLHCKLLTWSVPSEDQDLAATGGAATSAARVRLGLDRHRKTPW